MAQKSPWKNINDTDRTNTDRNSSNSSLTIV